jgi:hypothetical protein
VRPVVKSGSAPKVCVWTIVKAEQTPEKDATAMMKNGIFIIVGGRFDGGSECMKR